MGRIRSLWLFLGLVLFAVSFYDVTADVIPSENECRPYIEKAIHELKNTEPTATDENESTEENAGGDASTETITTSEAAVESSDDDNKSGEEAVNDDAKSQEDGEKESIEGAENSKEDDGQNSAEEEGTDSDKSAEVTENKQDNDSKEENQPDIDDDNDSKEDGEKSDEKTDSDDSKEEVTGTEDENTTNEEQTADGDDSKEVEIDAQTEDESAQKEDEAKSGQDNDESGEVQEEIQTAESSEDTENNAAENSADSKESQEDKTDSVETQTEEDNDTKEEGDQDQTEESNDTKEDDSVAEDNEDSTEEEKVRAKRSISDEATPEGDDNDTKEDTAEETDSDTDDNKSQENEAEASGKESQETEGEGTENESPETEGDGNESQEQEAEDGGDSKQAESDEETKSEEETSPEEELTLGFEIPKNLRSRTHISDLLGLDAESSIKENALKRTGDVILKDLKRIYDNAIKPLESMYKYRELSNRHYGDPEIFSKPLIVFMGPYSGGKSTILNYLTDNEYTPNSIRSGAEPSPAYFNILMHGDEPEVLDGTQLAADWTFSGLQKFGQGLNDRLRGQKLPSKLLERVNIVEIPGILEVRKQVSRYFPFNDACQWFIDRADIIFLVYDPAKLDVGPETEAILDQLKGREYQTRILLNKGDQVKPEELLRVQSALIWNISPLMSSAQPPVMYTVSLWSHPYEQGSPVRLLQAQERAMLADLREAIDKRIENKIASARRFAVRIRNHAKMVDCYLTTYYNQKSLFSNKKQVSDKIIEHPQNYNIYEGLSTLTNISRYDLPDPEVYLDFFRLNPLYEFKKLSETCTYFKGCPINKLDIAIAYDLPELVGKYKKLLDENYTQLRKEFDENCNQSNIEPPVKLNSR